MRLVVLRLLGVMPLEEIIMKSGLFFIFELPGHKTSSLLSTEA